MVAFVGKEQFWKDGSLMFGVPVVVEHAECTGARLDSWQCAFRNDSLVKLNKTGGHFYYLAPETNDTISWMF